MYVFELNKRYDLDGNVPENTARFINHSCDPNCEPDVIKNRIWLLSTRKIKKGEELSYNYGFDLECYEEHECRCGSKKCVGYITAEENWRKLKKLIAKKKKKEKKAARPRRRPAKNPKIGLRPSNRPAALPVISAQTPACRRPADDNPQPEVPAPGGQIGPNTSRR